MKLTEKLGSFIFTILFFLVCPYFFYIKKYIFPLEFSLFLLIGALGNYIFYFLCKINNWRINKNRYILTAHFILGDIIMPIAFWGLYSQINNML